jgi:hypothetical protein
MIFVLANLAGCQNSPGGLISPATEIFVSKVEPSFLQPELSEEGSSGDSEEKTIVLPALAISFNVSNGVSCFLNSYVIRYYTTGGVPLNDGKFDHSGAVSLFIKAPDVNWSTVELDEYTATAETVANQTLMEVFLPAVYSFMTKGNSVITDDITPVVARIEFSGKDVNDKAVSIMAQVNLSTTIKEEEDQE